jgi:hypothetical protein
MTPRSAQRVSASSSPKAHAVAESPARSAAPFSEQLRFAMLGAAEQ